MSNVYDIGDRVEVRGLFRDPDTWAEIDPTNVYLQIKNPAGTIATYEYGVAGSPITRVDVGDYRAEVDITASGEWYYRFYSTGVGQAAEEQSLSVRASQFV